VRAKVAPHRRFLRGEPKTHQFQLVVLPDGEDPVTANAVLVQQQLLPPWLLPVAAVLLVVAAALITLWFTVLRPTVASIAQDASQQQVSQAAGAARHASQAAQQASQAASAAQAASGGGSGGSGGGSGGGASAGGRAGGQGKSGGSGPSGAAAASSAAPAPIDFRIAASADPVTNGSFQNFSFTAPKHQRLTISDLVLQNPRGDSGFLQLEIGNSVVLQEGLANFRDLDYHYVSALHVNPDQPVVLAVNCTAPGAGATQCSPSVSFSGTLGP
jgi:type II secretory pathway pseudopilin PulG